MALAGCNAVSGIGDLRFGDQDDEGAGGGDGPGSTASSSTTGGAGGAGAGGSSAQGGSATSSASSSGTGGSGGAAMPPEIYACTEASLWRLDVTAAMVVKVVDFAGCGAVDELALREDGTLYGVTAGGNLVTIDKVGGTCIFLPVISPYPYGLHFVEGKPDLVFGYSAHDFLTTDLVSGQTNVTIDALDIYNVSGDSVGVGPVAYASVKGGGCADCIVAVDATTGTLREAPWSVGYNDVLGLAASGPFLYGFRKTGHVLRIEPAGHKTTEIAATGLYFEGAASRPSAP